MSVCVVCGDKSISDGLCAKHGGTAITRVGSITDNFKLEYFKLESFNFATYRPDGDKMFDMVVHINGSRIRFIGLIIETQELKP